MQLNFRRADGSLITEIFVDYINNRIRIINHTDDLLTRAFGCNEEPTMEDFEEFIESRSIPQTRYTLKTEAKMYGIQDTSPMGIVRHFGGRTADDDYYLEFLDDVEVKE